MMYSMSRGSLASRRALVKGAACRRLAGERAGGRPLPPPLRHPYCTGRGPTLVRRWPYILVVDDDPDFRDGLRAELERKGYEVAEAADGRQALAQIVERPPLLVLLDLQMPVMNGRELLQRLRATDG